MTIDPEKILFFEKVTRFDVTGFMRSYVGFMINDYPKIVAFFNAETEQINSEHFENLKYLVEKTDRISSIITLTKKQFQNSEYWLLVVLLEEMKVRLLTVANIHKVLRSLLINYNWNIQPEFDYITRKFQTLENVDRTALDGANSDNDWVAIAQRNYLFETDYNSNGGKRLILSGNIPGSIFVASVMDNLTGKRVYGIDLHRKIQFDTDEQDLLTLSYENTIFQAVEILTEIRKATVPEYPLMGLDSSVVVGSNFGSLSFPTILRQMVDLFSTDDTLVEFIVEKIYSEEDRLHIAFSVKSRYELIYRSLVKF